MFFLLRYLQLPSLGHIMPCSGSMIQLYKTQAPVLLSVVFLITSAHVLSDCRLVPRSDDKRSRLSRRFPASLKAGAKDSLH